MHTYGVCGSWVSVREMTKLSCVGTERMILSSFQAGIAMSKVLYSDHEAAPLLFLMVCA